MTIVSYEKQRINLDGVQNARQLGGYIGTDGKMVKNNIILRTGTLFTATADARRKLSERYRVSDVIDFRMAQEAEAMPEPDIKGARYHHLSVLNNIPVSKKEFELYKKLLNINDIVYKYKFIYEQKVPVDMAENYKIMAFSDEGKAGYRKFFDILLNKPENASVLFHCTQGKDRTGVAALLLLSALGADRETIISDYLLTNKAYGYLLDKIRNELTAANAGKEVIDYAMMLEGVSESFIGAVLKIMDREYGSVKGYLKSELDLTNADIKRLEEMYLE